MAVLPVSTCPFRPLVNASRKGDEKFYVVLWPAYAPQQAMHGRRQHMVAMEIWVYSDEQKTLRLPQLYRAQQN